MITVLVSGASGVVGYGVLKSLRASGGDYRLIGTTIYDDSVAPAFCDIFEQAPPTNSEGYITWLTDTIKKHDVDIIIPSIEIDMQTWNLHRETISLSGVKLLLNNQELVDTCVDKWEFYQRLIDTESRLAIETRLDGTFTQLKADFGLPFILKPRKGFASKGIVVVATEADFDANKQDLGSILMAQPIVGTKEEEYTVSAFFDNKSNLCCYMGLKRKLANEGFTEKARVADVAGVEDALVELAEIFKPVGPTNFQFREQDGQLKLLEINPRISSATSIRTAFGYNESEMGVEYFINGTVPKQPKIKRGYAVRYVEEKIFYDSSDI